ncbi:Plant galacturonosyltransferase GAUT protein [Dioscorea alata]|uniref:Plant galacturonosyltransferase GAUT protein n=1 Tax=Dioscorea alata TaxID=55571 RepID=A0ACB7UU62_DIOAL|nr:Plant galacturonosyltransferase GAUT protein [Dioscorea alata]
MKSREGPSDLRTDSVVTELGKVMPVKLSTQFNRIVGQNYSIWRREFYNSHPDSLLRHMKDQIIVARVYHNIARSKKISKLTGLLSKHIKESEREVGEANSDFELHISAFAKAKEMELALMLAKREIYDCYKVTRQLRAMLESSEEFISAEKKRRSFLLQLASKTMAKPLHCLPMQLTTDYFLNDHHDKEPTNMDKLVDPSFYHYAIFSDNVLATSVVVNSTVAHARDPNKHVFHIVTNRLNFAAMKMWFLVHPLLATVHVENIDDLRWFNSSYSPVLNQLNSLMTGHEVNYPAFLPYGRKYIKYRNPKYLSMLNHLRFYLPEVYPKLDKILFLDDDVVVQKDLTPLWSIDMKGMVNAAVEINHGFDAYLDFSKSIISENFDPHAYAWAFGMNVFDLKEWKKRNLTGVYHLWQVLNKDQNLWKLGSLPPGLITFNNLIHPLDQTWHVLGLGYNPILNLSKIEEAAVIHYNGNYKPWLDLAIPKYKPYWSKFIDIDDQYIQSCNFHL